MAATQYHRICGLAAASELKYHVQVELERDILVLKNTVCCVSTSIPCGMLVRVAFGRENPSGFHARSIRASDFVTGPNIEILREDFSFRIGGGTVLIFKLHASAERTLIGMAQRPSQNCGKLGLKKRSFI